VSEKNERESVTFASVRCRKYSPKVENGRKKIDKEDVKNCLQPETVSALCIIARERHTATATKNVHISDTKGT
jgi:hypothetical protein